MRGLLVLGAQFILLLSALSKFLNTSYFLLQEIKFKLKVLVFLHRIAIIVYLNALAVFKFLMSFHLKTDVQRFLFDQ